MSLYLYVHNKYTQYTHTQCLCKQKLLFWMQLILINRLTALHNNNNNNNNNNNK